MEMTIKQQTIFDYMGNAHSEGADIIQTILGMRITSFFSSATSVTKIELLQVVKIFAQSQLGNMDYQISKDQQSILDYMKDQYSSNYLDILELIWRMEIKPIFNRIRNLTKEEKLQVIHTFTEWALEEEIAWE